MLTLLIVSFVILLVVGVPIAFAMLGSSILLLLFLDTGDLIQAPHRLVNGLNSFVLVAIPLFMLVGQLMVSTDFLDRLLALSRQLVGRLTGGLAQINILASMLFSGISGTATGDTAAIGSTMIPAMKRDRYHAEFSAAVTAASSSLGPIIPPSILMIILGALVGISVGQLFLGGVLPGLIGGFGMMFATFIISKKRGYSGLPDVETSWRALVQAVIGAIGPLLIPVIILGGIISGVFTPTEAAGIAVAVVLVFSLGIYRNLSLRRLWSASRASVQLVGPVMLAIGAASLLSNLLVMQGVGELIVSTILPFAQTPTIVLLLVAAISILLGLFLESIAILILIGPILFPLVQAAGVDPIHFGIVFVQAVMIGVITPPVGVVMFLASSIAEVRLDKLTRALVPFYVVLLATLLISILFPEAILFLPRTLFPGG